ncbi:UNVERIFIED_CONTAM: hypothetical protein Sindi_2462300, partial [Sesamum indicum]
MQYPNDAGSSQSSRYDKVIWNSKMKRVFIELMHEEFITHRLQSSTFPPSVWARITDRMNSIMGQGCRFTMVQLKGKLNRLRRAWGLFGGAVSGPKKEYRNRRGRTFGGAENPDYKKIIQHGLQRFDVCTQMFSRNTASGGLARSSSQQRRTIHNNNNIDDEQMDDTQSGSRRSRD